MPGIELDIPAIRRFDVSGHDRYTTEVVKQKNMIINKTSHIIMKEEYFHSIINNYLYTVSWKLIYIFNSLTWAACVQY